MDTVGTSGSPPTAPGSAARDDFSWAGRGADNSPEHRCPVPGYLRLPDLAMIWQCLDCGEIWQLVADRRAPGSPLEFVWVTDPLHPADSLAG